ncbi:hypothetical protein [Legionella maioricensis]|uniref:Lipoprotein n=1 Tax=Legionella maioricensis TaxID=2896528 RepID=A0A9X2CYN7_9GAMM|nr:hypothetical protein [Legionella maioricensis]MCL9683147.1 hypothetical protein [Legionella maioricensis]MCL9688046.1 hypothetical protein [Legionella maioricensis]
MKTIIITVFVLLPVVFLTGCTAKTYYGPNYSKTYVYSGTDDLYSKRVDYLGYGLGGQGLGGYGMGGYGLVGYGGEAPGM